MPVAGTDIKQVTKILNFSIPFIIIEALFFPFYEIYLKIHVLRVVFLLLNSYL